MLRYCRVFFLCGAILAPGSAVGKVLDFFALARDEVMSMIRPAAHLQVQFPVGKHCKTTTVSSDKRLKNSLQFSKRALILYSHPYMRSFLPSSKIRSYRRLKRFIETKEISNIWVSFAYDQSRQNMSFAQNLDVLQLKYQLDLLLAAKKSLL